MSNRTLNLNHFILRQEDEELKQDLISVMSELDNDLTDDAEKIVDEIYNLEEDDDTNMNNVLDYVKKSHGDFSSQFMYDIAGIQDGYALAVAYLT